MSNRLRKPTLETLGLGTLLEIFKNSRLPVQTGDMVDRVFGPPADRGALVISGANGIVGAGKTMQLGSRLEPFGIPIIALDFPGVADGLGKQFPGLSRAFGKARAHEIMQNVIRLHTDGSRLPSRLNAFKPKFLLEAIPEILEIKKSHYQIFKTRFPDIEIRSVTSGFPSSQLGVGITHPAFPHEINKIFEVVESKPSAITHLLWSLGLIPVPVSDHWSFVLDVLFCGVTLAALRFHQLSNTPFWKIDKYVRKQLGPNPFRAHDAIGAKGANFLTWSCLNDLSKHYGDLFTPTPELVERKDTGQNWYPLNHSRPLVNWALDDDEQMKFKTWILGPSIQMASLLLKEKRSHLSQINAIGELCAQFRRGILAEIRSLGAEPAKKLVEQYHRLHPAAAKRCWHPETFDEIGKPEWQQLYVNAEHDGKIGVISISRESYNQDVDDELNRAIDWLKVNHIDRVIVTGDFHLSTQMVGADTNEFFPALHQPDAGLRISLTWSKTARRFNDAFQVSVGFINGKRCLGGFLELLMHCHYLVAIDDAELGMPEVTLPVIPGMEGCHWPFRKAKPEDWPKLFKLLLEGKFVRAVDSVGWLTDFSGPLENALSLAWNIAIEGNHRIARRRLESGSLKVLSSDIGHLLLPGDADLEAARKAILDTIREACQAKLSEALEIQARHSAAFMAGPLCQKGVIGSEYRKTILV